MKFKSIACLGLAAVSLLAQGQKQPPSDPPAAAPPPPPPVSFSRPTPQPGGPTFTYEQKQMASRQYLVTPEQAQNIINRFKEAYAKMGHPRLLIYVNRELVDQSTGVRLSGRREQIESSRGVVRQTSSTNAAANPTDVAEKSTVKNFYHVAGPKETPLADRQTMRDVERLFGRPLRMGGASLADQRVATQLIGDRPLSNFTSSAEGEHARKDREALSKIADVVLEVLISSRTMTAPEVSGNRNYSVPDIQATAIRLSDAKILGQASSSDLLGRSGRTTRGFDVREVTEATALALMEDMLLQ